MLRQGQQAFFLSRYGDSLVAMRMHDAESVFARGVNGAVNRESGRVDVIWSLHQDLTVEVDFDQARGGYLVEHHAVGIDQELVAGSRDAGGNMGEDQIVPSE